MIIVTYIQTDKLVNLPNWRLVAWPYKVTDDIVYVYAEETEDS